MAPVDRREHRQQRVRGAGPSSVQASFGFNFGVPGAKPAKPAEPAKPAALAPQLSARRTPLPTPRPANSSARRHRSASVQPSSSSRRGKTPKEQTQTRTPQLNTKNRPAPTAQPSDDHGDEDELSPGREEGVRSMEKSRRVVGAVSPVREEADDAVDELSVLGEGGSAARKTTVASSAGHNGTPMSVLAEKRIFAGNPLKRTPVAHGIGTMSSSRQAIARRSKSKSTEPVPETPSVLPNRRPRLSAASLSRAQLDTPTAHQADEDSSEDELSPPQVNGAAPRIVATQQQRARITHDALHADMDELSPAQPTPAAQPVESANVPERQDIVEPTAIEPPAKRGRPRRIVLEDDGEALSVPAVKTTKRGRPANGAKAAAVATPTSRRPSKKDASATTQEEQNADQDLDELSPDKDRNANMARQSAKRPREVMDVSDVDESDAYEEPEPDEEAIPTPRAAQRTSPKRAHNLKPSSEKPPRKRAKFLGPKHAISVMRIKGSTVRGITVADTTRTILEETIDHRLNRMAEKLQASKDSTRRKELRGELNVFFSFKESLNEKLLDLQDANDVLSTNLKKMKLFRRDNAELRKDILALQHNRQEVALEHDHVQAQFDAEKAKVDARNKLSEDMFSIEAAIQNGRKKARQEGKEDEGPKVPLSMLLGMVGEDVGSSGGGLLHHVKFFNGALERAAGWLEGRA